MPGEELDLGIDMPGSGDGMPDAVDVMNEESSGDDALMASGDNELDDVFADADELNDEDEIAEMPEEQAKPQSKREKGINARIRAGVEKGVRREMDAMRSSFSAEIQKAVEAATAPLRSQLESYQSSAIEREAQNLVETKQVATLELARMVAQQKYGASVKPAATPEPNQAPNNPKGKQSVDQRTDFLANQAIVIEAGGIPLRAFLEKNPAVFKKVYDNPKLNMYHIVDYMQKTQKAGSIPTPMRSANGGKVPKISPKSMSDSQFDKLDELLDKGQVFLGRG